MSTATDQKPQSGQQCTCGKGRLRVRTSRKIGGMQQQWLDCTGCDRIEKIMVPADLIARRRCL